MNNSVAASVNIINPLPSSMTNFQVERFGGVANLKFRAQFSSLPNESVEITVMISFGETSNLPLIIPFCFTTGCGEMTDDDYCGSVSGTDPCEVATINLDSVVPGDSSLRCNIAADCSTYELNLDYDSVTNSEGTCPNEVYTLEM